MRAKQSIILIAGMLVAGGSVWAQGNSGDNVRALNNRVLQFHSQMRGAGASQAAQIRSQAAPVLAERATALSALVKSNPSAALSLAFSQDLLNDLAQKFPGSANSLEEQGTWEGVSDHLIFDDPDRQVRRFQVQITAGGNSLEVYSAGGEPHCVSGNILKVKGVRIGNAVAAADANVSGTGDVAAAGCTTTGAQNSVIILINFPGLPLPANVTPTSVWDIFFSASGRSVDGYWREASYNKASATGVVVGPYTVDRVYTCDEYYQMRAAAIAAADAAVNFTSYTRVFLVFPNPGSCAWAGLGTLGCGTISSADGNFTASTSWLRADYMGSRDNGVKLSTHEGGHNLTLHHASSRDFGATEILGPVGAAGTLNEYGGTTSTMGSWNFGHYDAPHKARMGWLSGGNILTTETAGSHTILPFETSTSGVQALKVRRGTGNAAWLWLEYRQPVGIYDSTLNSQVHTGAVVHYEDSTTGTRTHLLDFTKGSTAGYSDPALVTSWADTYTNVSLAITNQSASGLSLNVNYGPVPCVRVQPTISISPANPSVYSGSNVNYNVTVTNNDSSGCTATTFTMGSSLPAGWGTTTFNPPTLNINPGANQIAVMTKSVPADFTPGTYGVNATTSDIDHAPATATANCTVTAPPTPISITSFTALPTTVKVRSTVTISATVKNSSNVAVSGASVTFTVVKPSGSSSTKTATTNASGVATWAYKAQNKGNYSATAAASAGGASANAGPVVFTAN